MRGIPTGAAREAGGGEGGRRGITSSLLGARRRGTRRRGTRRLWPPTRRRGGQCPVPPLRYFTRVTWGRICLQAAVALRQLGAAPPRGLPKPRPPAPPSPAGWPPRFLRQRRAGGASRPAPPLLRRLRSRSPSLPPGAPVVGGGKGGAPPLPSDAGRGRSGCPRCMLGRARAGPRPLREGRGGARRGRAGPGTAGSLGRGLAARPCRHRGSRGGAGGQGPSLRAAPEAALAWPAAALAALLSSQPAPWGTLASAVLRSRCPARSPVACSQCCFPGPLPPGWQEVFKCGGPS